MSCISCIRSCSRCQLQSAPLLLGPPLPAPPPEMGRVGRAGRGMRHQVTRAWPHHSAGLEAPAPLPFPGAWMQRTWWRIPRLWKCQSLGPWMAVETKSPTNSQDGGSQEKSIFIAMPHSLLAELWMMRTKYNNNMNTCTPLPLRKQN